MESAGDGASEPMSARNTAAVVAAGVRRRLCVLILARRIGRRDGSTLHGWGARTIACFGGRQWCVGRTGRIGPTGAASFLQELHHGAGAGMHVQLLENVLHVAMHCPD